MSIKYPHLLSPIKVGNVIFKNRMFVAPSKPSIQGPELYPTEALINHYANRAKNGAACVTCTIQAEEVELPVIVEKMMGMDYKHRIAFPRHEPSSKLGVNDHEIYLSQLTEAIHFYGAKASIPIFVIPPGQYDVSAGIRLYPLHHDRSVYNLSEEIPEEMLDEIAERYALQAALMKDLGFDMVYLHMCYGLEFLGRFLSPLTNKRKDKYGGSLENQARFPIQVADRIKQKCGKDFLIEASISGSEDHPDGYTLDDAIEYAKMFAGHIDLLQPRASDHEHAHPTNFYLEPTPFLYMSEAIKKSGADITVVAIAGFTDLDICEDTIASGKADFISMARAWISNPEFGRMAYEGRGEDVVPCIRCNGCHRISKADSWASVCTVNPIYSLEHKIEKMIEPPREKRKVAVIGGGPAGMEAALVAAGRGHQVTLYERSDALGGLLKTADNVSFKWTLRDFKNYLVHQIEKSGVSVCLNTEATPEMLKAEEYHVLLVAVGSEPIMPDIPGVDSQNVVFAQDVYGKEDTLAKEVVVIGGGEVGVETGMHLAEKGHQVTVLEMLDMLASDAPPVHYYSMFKEAWEKLKNFRYILKARCNGFGADKVSYVDAGGNEHTIKDGSVVIAVGYKARNDLALKFSGAGDRCFIIGDCNKVGNVQKAMRSAYGTAVMI